MIVDSALWCQLNATKGVSFETQLSAKGLEVGGGR